MKRASYYGVLLIVVTLFISLYFNKEQPNDNGSSDELYLDTVYVFYSDEKEAWVINDNNWKQHPEIIEVKKVYNSFHPKVDELKKIKYEFSTSYFFLIIFFNPLFYYFLFF